MRKSFATAIAATSSFLFAASTVFAQGGTTIAPSIPTQLINNNQLTINGVISFVIGLLVVVGILAALLYLIYGAIKWITSGGDKAAVEAARGHIVAAIIGIVVLVLSLLILNFVLQIVGAVPQGGNIFQNLNIPTLACPQGFYMEPIANKCIPNGS